jgi:Tol biopolymer transport system component
MEGKMSENLSDALPDETPPDPASVSLSKHKKGVFLVIGGVGCVFTLCLGLLIGSGIFFVRSALTAPADNEVVVLPGGEESQPAGSLTEMSAANEPGTEAGEVASGPPEMGPLTFALETTATGEPVESEFSFAEGTTQIHALFEYANLTPAHSWSQVWYYNGSEVSRTSQPWLEGVSGTYDYLIEASGEPLPVGEWALEFYINDELLTAGSFMIEGLEDALAADVPDLADLPQIYLLVYPKWNGEKHDLYLNDTNGSREQFILGRAAGPSWSLDSRYIFVYGEEGIDQLYPQSGVTNGIMRLTATALPANASQIQLYQGHGWNDGTARWANVAPDGTMIAYDGDRGGGRRIYFLGTAANQQFRYEIIGEQADWSPDSQKIVYRSGRNNQTGIWISNRTDSGHTRITSGGTDSFPTWSPDSQTIAFSRDVGGSTDIYTVNVDGSNLQRLTDTPGHDTLPAYLPNGDLVFRSTRSGSWSIWKMKGDGSDQVEIILKAPVGPDWSFSRIGVLR